MWNIRIVKEDTDEGDVLTICEVYYDHLGAPIGYCKADPCEQSMYDLKQYVLWMIEALDKPHYKTTDFKKPYANYPDLQ